MKKKILNGINVILGALTLGFLGCKNTPKECLYGPPPPEDLYGPPVPEEMIMAKYGPPWMLNGEEDPNPAGQYVPTDTVEEQDKQENK